MRHEIAGMAVQACASVNDERLSNPLCWSVGLYSYTVYVHNTSTGEVKITLAASVDGLQWVSNQGFGETKKLAMSEGPL